MGPSAGMRYRCTAQHHHRLLYPLLSGWECDSVSSSAIGRLPKRVDSPIFVYRIIVRVYGRCTLSTIWRRFASCAAAVVRTSSPDGGNGSGGGSPSLGTFVRPAGRCNVNFPAAQSTIGHARVAARGPEAGGLYVRLIRWASRRMHAQLVVVRDTRRARLGWCRTYLSHPDSHRQRRMDPEAAARIECDHHGEHNAHDECGDRHDDHDQIDGYGTSTFAVVRGGCR